MTILILRSAIGGFLMGLANLVPGISGGTMLLAAGIYPRFVQAVAEVTTLKFKAEALAVLGAVVVSAGLAILLLAGTVKNLVVDHRWVMYSLFIGLTLGGVPVVWKMAAPVTRRVWFGAAAGFLAMALVAAAQMSGYGAGESGRGSIVMLFIAGIAGASAMILPGISGGYLLLILGQYIPILSGIDLFKNALRAGDFGAALEPALQVGLPVGLGVIAGVVLVSNLVRLLLKRYEQVTLGVLLGLLLGAVVGLWPFQEGVPPDVGDVVKGQVMTVALVEALDPEDYPSAFFTPSGGQVAGALGLIVLGFGITWGIALVGGSKKRESVLPQERDEGDAL